MLKSLDRELWVAEQPFKYLGLPVSTKMTVILRSGGRLVLISPIKIDTETKAQLDSIGKVEFIIAPNLFHYLYIQGCQQLYPQAKLIAPPGLKTKQPDLALDLTFCKDEISFDGELEYTLFKGFQTWIPPQIKPLNEIVFFHPVSKTLILTDTAFNFDRSFPFVTQLAARVIGCYENLRPSWLEKIATKDKEGVKDSLKKILAWDFQRIIMAHGNIVEVNAKERFLAGYQWFLDTEEQIFC
ncbi:MAG: DUF4336 domain-containing protein [Xenococcaceae cyanobacterium]